MALLSSGQDGYWEPTPKLGELIKVNFHLFVDVFLQRKGIRSLGETFPRSSAPVNVMKKVVKEKCVCVCAWCLHGSGEKAHADIVRLVATLLVLQFMRLKKLEEGKLLRTLFSLEEPTLFRSEQKTVCVCVLKHTHTQRTHTPNRIAMLFGGPALQVGRQHEVLQDVLLKSLTHTLM